MTTALLLIGLPAGREYDKIATKEEPVINEAMIKKFIAYLDVSKTTLNKYKYCLNVFLGWMKSRGYKKDYLTSDQIKSILSKIDKQTLIGKRDYSLLLLALTDGLRTIEISRADVSDLRINGNSEVLYIQGKGRLEKDEFISGNITARSAAVCKTFIN